MLACRRSWIDFCPPTAGPCDCTYWVCSPVWLKAMPGPIGQGFATALDDLPAAISAWVEGLLSVGIGPTHSGPARRQQESRHPNRPAGGLTVLSPARSPNVSRARD